MWACQDASIQVCRTAPRHGMHKHVVAMHFKVGYKFVQFLKHNSRSLSLVFQLHTTRYFHVNLVWIFRCRTTNSSQLYRIGSSFVWFYGRRPKRETGLPSATAAHSYTRATNTAMVPIRWDRRYHWRNNWSCLMVMGSFEVLHCMATLFAMTRRSGMVRFILGGCAPSPPNTLGKDPLDP